MNRPNLNADQLESLLINYFQKDVTKYSGRFMYGKECPGLIVDSFTELLVDLTDGIYQKLTENNSTRENLRKITVHSLSSEISDQKKAEIELFLDDVEQIEIDLLHLKDALKCLEVDSLGLGYVGYFPKYTY